MNISSVIIKTSSAQFQNIIDTLSSSNLCEVHASENQKIVITLEGKDTEEEVNKLKQIEKMEGVISAEMVYAYSEDELEKERNKIEQATQVPEWLNDNNIKAEQIKYKGDLRSKI